MTNGGTLHSGISALSFSKNTGVSVRNYSMSLRAWALCNRKVSGRNR